VNIRGSLGNFEGLTGQLQQLRSEYQGLYSKYFVLFRINEWAQEDRAIVLCMPFQHITM
jgi:hypothetical protein